MGFLDDILRKLKLKKTSPKAEQKQPLQPIGYGKYYRVCQNGQVFTGCQFSIGDQNYDYLNVEDEEFFLQPVTPKSPYSVTMQEIAMKTLGYVPECASHKKLKPANLSAQTFRQADKNNQQGDEPTYYIDI